MAFIIPSMPLLPNPPGTIIPSYPESSLSFSFLSFPSKIEDDIQVRLGF